MPADRRKITFVAELGKRRDTPAVQQQGFVGYAAADDVVVTAVLEAELLAQAIGRKDIIAREHVRTRECALYLFRARIDTYDLPPATGKTGLRAVAKV